MLPRRVVMLNWRDSTHPEAGGSEAYCQNIARELVAAGVQVTFLTSRTKGTATHEVCDGYIIRRFGGRYTVYLWVMLWLLVHRLSVEAVIDTQNGIPFFSPLVLRRRTPITMLVHHVHQDQFAMYFARPIARIGRWLEKSASKRVYDPRAISAVSPSTRTEVRRRLGFAGPIWVAPNGNGLSAPIAAQRSTRPKITCVGRLVPHKRWHLLIKAAATVVQEIPELRVEIIGDGPERAALETLTESLGLTRVVNFRGYVSDEERDQQFAESWLTVSTSVSEGWGLSIIEAATHGVPAVAVDVPGLRDSVRSGVTGWLTTEQQLARTMTHALAELRDPAGAADKYERCVAWAGALHWSASAERLRSVLTSEAERLAQPHDRRSARADAATLLSLDRGTAHRFDITRLRVTDQTTFCAECVDRIDGPWRVLLHGADEHDALAVIDRLGLTPELERINLTLCRSTMLIQWHGEAAPHNAPREAAVTECPAVPAQRALARDGRRIA